MFQDLQWVVQKKLTNHNDWSALEQACQKLGIPFIAINIIPFSNELPAFHRSPRNIFYGSTTFNKLAFEDPQLKTGVFFHPESFSIDRYIREWGESMLNYGARGTTVEDLMRSDYDPDQLLFIRPDDDGKSFAGEVIQFADCVDWFGRVKAVENSGISPESKIVVGEPYNIGREWRLWCVNKKVIAASQYRNNFRLDKRQGCPDEVVEYAEQRCLQYTPHDIFVMDVCESGGDLYVVECNCMNAAGFYLADVEAIVRNVSGYFL